MVAPHFSHRTSSRQASHANRRARTLAVEHDKGPLPGSQDLHQPLGVQAQSRIVAAAIHDLDRRPAPAFLSVLSMATTSASAASSAVGQELITTQRAPLRPALSTATATGAPSRRLLLREGLVMAVEDDDRGIVQGHGPHTADRLPTTTAAPAWAGADPPGSSATPAPALASRRRAPRHAAQKALPRGRDRSALSQRRPLSGPQPEAGAGGSHPGRRGLHHATMRSPVRAGGRDLKRLPGSTVTAPRVARRNGAGRHVSPPTDVPPNRRIGLHQFPACL